MIENEAFFKIMGEAGFDVEDAQKSAIEIEKVLIRTEVFREMSSRHMTSAHGPDEDLAEASKERYFQDLLEYWNKRVRIEAAQKNLKDMSDEDLSELAEQCALDDFNKYYGFQTKIIDGIIDAIYDMRSSGTSDLEESKNLYFAIALCEFQVEADDPRVAQFVALYDDMLPGTLHNPDSSEFLPYLFTAQNIIAAQGEFDGVTDVE